jgi:hypothetical protein
VENAEQLTPEQERRRALVTRLVAELEAEDEGVGDEIAASRLVMARLLTLAEIDPIKAAHALADLAGVIARLRTYQRVSNGDAIDSLAEAATRILEELGYGR